MFKFDRAMEGQGHLTDKVACPRCGYPYFSVEIHTDMSGFSASCNNCSYHTYGISGLQGILEDRLRAVIKVDMNDKNYDPFLSN